MTRNEATAYAKSRLKEFGLDSYRVQVIIPRVATEGFMGQCNTKDKVISLNAHHIDTHPDSEVKDTINHEIAHALSPEDNMHGLNWKLRCVQTGARPLACQTFGISPAAIEAMRNGDILEIETEKVTKIVMVPTEVTIQEPKYKITRFVDKCDVCGKQAVEDSTKEFRSGGKLKKMITLKCGHIRIVDSDSQSAFDLITFDGDPDCKHEWNKTVCSKCNAKRLFQYQIDGARFLEKQNGRAAVFDEMGLGKTIQALAYLKFHPEAFPALFIVKSGIKFQWMNEIMRVLGEKYFPQVISDSKQGVMPGLKCYITSYDLLRNFSKEKIKSLNLQTVVLDEVQQIKNPDSARTREVRNVCREIPHLIPLSGTPWKNRGSEFFVVLNMLDPVKFHSYQAFLDRWVEYYWDGNKHKQGGIRKPLEFKEHIKDIAIRRQRNEVMKELPEISRLKLHCEIAAAERKAYDDEVSDFVKWYNQLIIDGEEDSPSASQNAIARLQRMRHILGLAKIPFTVEWIEEFIEETDRKLVVFVHHKDVGQILINKLTPIGRAENVPIMQLHAGLSSEERFAVQERFNKCDRAIMVASTLASGEGLNLQTCADCIMHERQWNPMNEEQAEGRFIRIGQQASAVNATYIHVSKSVDTHLDGIVETKRMQFHKVMNKGELPIWNESNLIKELTQALINEAK